MMTCTLWRGHLALSRRHLIHPVVGGSLEGKWSGLVFGLGAGWTVYGLSISSGCSEESEESVGVEEGGSGRRVPRPGLDSGSGWRRIFLRVAPMCRI